MKIRVVSKRKNGTPKLNGESIIYIGRPSHLGNPFAMRNESDRECVVAKYRLWLPHEYAKKGNLYFAIQDLMRRLKNGEVIALECWCAPEACHGDEIIKFIHGLTELEER